MKQPERPTTATSRRIFPAVVPRAPRSIGGRAVGRALDVSLVTEGTYPFHEGGVSVWCDQIVRGLAPHRFHIDAITAGVGGEPSWRLPSNVVAVRSIPLWDAAARVNGGRRLDPAVKEILEPLLMAVATDDVDGGFLPSLEALADLASDGVLARSLATNGAVDLTLSAMRSMSVRRPVIGEIPSPTLADAASVIGLLEHLLRPLAADPVRADVCHASSNGAGALVAMASKWQLGTPFLLTEHGVYLRERYIEYAPGSMPHARRAFLLGYYKRLTAAAYQMADTIAPGSDYNRRWEQANGASRDAIQPIHNGIDPGEFNPTTPEPTRPTLVWAGRIDPLKDVKTMLRAFALVREKVPGATLRIVGGTPLGNEEYRRECVELHEQLGLGASAVFEGRVRSIEEAYASGNVVVATSISEGFPYAVLEAMASGRAMIATDVGGVWEAIDEAGVLVAPQDDRGLADACIRLLRDPQERSRLAAAGRERVRSRFRVELCLERYAELYDDLGTRAA